MKTNILEIISSKLDVREFSAQNVSREIKQWVLEAARMTGTGLNTQHCRFLLVESHDRLAMLADDSTSGKWVAGANFAIVVLTNPGYAFHMIDAGRVLQNVQLAAWSLGVASGVFTGTKEEMVRKDFEIPHEMNVTLVAGFGYPAENLTGKKSRIPLNELVYYEKYGNRSA